MWEQRKTEETIKNEGKENIGFSLVFCQNKIGARAGMIARSQEIIDADLYPEASHYVLHVMVDLLEN